MMKFAKHAFVDETGVPVSGGLARNHCTCVRDIVDANDANDRLDQSMAVCRLWLRYSVQRGRQRPRCARVLGTARLDLYPSIRMDSGLLAWIRYIRSTGLA